MSSIINGFIIFSLIITCTYFVGLLTFINDHEENKCEMTYMFEYPQFVRISNEIDAKYPKYGLHAYSEGRFTQKARNMFFDGVPVLFIPGNAGSHRQGRSLASVALRKAYNSHMPYHFDYFLVDLNNELSGMNGALLNDQLEYVNNSIYRILELYKGRKNAPQTIILIGHSMGGIIARRLVANIPDDSALVPVVITLASPHKRPPLMLDSYLHDFYKQLDFNETNNNTTVVSISGGYSDFLVAPYLTIAPHFDLNIMTTQTPRSWVAADHVCILWCKQTILVLNRVLFDLVDTKTRQISQDPDFRKSVFRHHLVQHNGIKPHLRDNYKLKANIRNDGEWIEPLGRQFTIHVPLNSRQAYFYMVRLVNQPQHEILTVVGINMDVVDWVYACGAHMMRGNSRVCEEFHHLTHLSEISPSTNYKRRTLTLNLHELQANNPDLSHVVVRMLPTDEPVILHFDVYGAGERHLTVNLPNMFSLKRQVIIGESPEKVVRFELALPHLTHVMQSYQLFVDATGCSTEMRHATASLIVPWGHQNQHEFFVGGVNKPMHLRLYGSRPAWAHNQSAVVQLTLDPSCRYQISIRASIVGMLGQMARFYSPLLVVNVAAVVLLTLNSQLKSMATERRCSLFLVAVRDGAKPYYILTTVKLLSRLLSIKPLVNYVTAPDWLILSQDGTDLFLLPLLLYLCSVGIVWLLGIFLSVSLVVCETTVHKFALKFLARTVSFTVNWSDYLMSALHKIPVLVATTLVCLSLSTTGSLALCVGMVFYFLRLTQLSQDLIEELVWFYVKKFTNKFKKKTQKDDDNEPKDKDQEVEEKKDNNKENSESSARDAIFFHASLFLLWSLVTMINIPSVLTWAHNFKHNTVLQPDPSFLPGLVLSICAVPLWQMELPKIERRGYVEMSRVMTVLAVISLIYAPVSIFRLNYTLPIAFVVVTLHQLLAPNRDLSVAEEQPPPRITYEMIKAKWE